MRSLPSDRPPFAWRRAAGFVALLSLIGCGGAGESSPDPARADPSRELSFELTMSPYAGGPERSNRSLVRNLDGSTWRGAARLVPEATIGEAEGPPELTFGRIADIAATREHVYVLETQPPVIRMYTHDGAWVADLGRRGSGPGEFEWPSGLTVVEETGTILVEHKNPGELLALTLEGEPRDPLKVEHWRAANDLRVTTRGLARTVVLSQGKGDGANPFRRDLAIEWRPLSGGPAEREPLAVPEGMPPVRVVECDGGGAIATPIPFAPDFHWAPLADGNWITGTSDGYRFRIHRLDRPDRVVERYWEPIPTSAGERAWRARLAGSGAKCGGPGTKTVRSDVPELKRAYDDLFDDGSGRIWVVREGPGKEHPDCASVADGPGEWRLRPCWTPTRLIDVFSSSGMYLGPLDAPESLLTDPRPIAMEERLLAVTLDDAGVYRLGWFRWELPEGAPPN